MPREDHLLDLKLVLDKHVDGIPKRGIIHIGAHQGEEVAYYLELGFESIILIEANPKWYRYLVDKFKDNSRIKIYSVAISDTIGEMDFYIHTSQSGSTEPASLLKMKEFNNIVKSLRTTETIKVQVLTLDHFLTSNGLSPQAYNFINVDVQGAEMMAFKGASTTLKTTDVIISEINLVELYEHATLENELVQYLQQRGFEKTNVIYHTLYDEKGTFPAWGECLFIKKT
jgi:FkbM family methyltransferase